MGTFDEILNVAIPFILIAVAVGFFWTKIFEPMLLPMFKKMYNYFQSKSQGSTSSPNLKEISYE